MKPLRIIFIIWALSALLSCQDDWKFSADSRYALAFSADTVKMDTVFTGIASASAGFMVYNTNDVGLRFDAVMGGGAASAFRMNLDGEGGAMITGLEIPAGDSLFCFVSVNIPSTDDPALLHAFDSIRFVMESGNVQFVRLSAYGQNAIRLKGEQIGNDTVFTARLPYIIYDSLSIAQGATLTVRPGARLYFHRGAVLDVSGRILAQGTADSMIVMRGDRLDMMLEGLPYDLLSGEWGGVVLRSNSYGNVLSYCDIHGGEWGVKADSAGMENTKLSISSSIIHNVSGTCLEATGCRVDVANSQLTNGGQGCVDLAGGSSEFVFCTIAAFSIWNLADQAVRLSDYRGGGRFPLSGASFRNCIITGRHASEFIVDVADSIRKTAEYSVSNSLLMVRDSADVRFSNVVFENSRSKAYGATNFVDRTLRDYSSTFALDSLSPARGIADSLSLAWPVDLSGTPRPPSGADAGCYQYKP